MPNINKVHQICEYLKDIERVHTGGDYVGCSRCPEKVDWGHDYGEGTQMCYLIANELLKIAQGTHPFWERKMSKRSSKKVMRIK